MDDNEVLRIAVLGSGPIGLEAALYGRYLGYVVSLFDKQAMCASLLNDDNPLGSAFRENCTPLGLAALAAQNQSYQHPQADQLLTIGQWIAEYCSLLAQTDLVTDTLRIGSRVESIEFAADDQTYNLVAKTADRSTVCETFDYVIDTRVIDTKHARLVVAPESFSDFAASTTDDFFVIEGRDVFDFRAATQAIRQAYATIGERDELNLYDSLKQFQI